MGKERSQSGYRKPRPARANGDDTCTGGVRCSCRASMFENNLIRIHKLIYDFCTEIYVNGLFMKKEGNRLKCTSNLRSLIQ